MAKHLHMAYVAFGSNIGTTAGDCSSTIRAGLRALSEALGSSGGGLRASSLYETTPVGYREQPSFINGVAALKTSLAPEELLQALLGVEQAFGRYRSVRNGPRTLDLDLLMVDDLVVSTERLVLPHPRLHERRFVLAPLVEIAPELVHPVRGRTMSELLTELPNAGEQAVAGVRRLHGAVV